MKKQFWLFVFPLILLTPAINAQWMWQNPVPTGNFLSSIKCVNQSKAFIVGSGSTIVKSTDSGDSWKLLSVPPMGYLYDIDSYGENLLVAVGEDGLIARSTDGGNVWTTKTLPIQTNLVCISIISQNLMVAAGGTKIVKSTDGGVTWTVPTTPGLPHINDILMVSTQTGYAVGGSVFRTTDACQSFNKMTLPYTDMFLSVSVPSSFAIYIASAKALYKSTDGGITWMNPCVFKDFSVVKMFFATEDLGYVIGKDGVAQRSTDGGNNWEYISAPTTQPLNGIATTFNGDLLVCGGAGSIFKQINGNWKDVTQAVSRADICSIHFLNSLEGLCCGSEGTILKTTDGGKTWNKKNTAVNDSLKAVYMLTSSIAFAFGSACLRSSDGGESWNRIDFPTTSTIYGLFFADKATGFACGTYGTIVKTTDEGITWETQITGTSNTLNGLYFLDKNTGYCVGFNTILKTTDGGKAWMKKLDAGGPLYAVSFKNNSAGLAFGGTISAPLLFGTTDAGESWNNMNNPPCKGIFTGKYVSAENIYAGSVDGAIIKSTDDGESWSNTCWQVGNPILSIASVNDSTIWACGYSTILRYGSNWLTDICENKIQTAKSPFIQNYPNPFNPSTVIQYKIPHKGRVRLTVYDILGNEVTLLIDEVKEKGEYQMIFDASHLAGGIYFCRLAVDANIVEVRKLVFVK